MERWPLVRRFLGGINYDAVQLVIDLRLAGGFRQGSLEQVSAHGPSLEVVKNGFFFQGNDGFKREFPVLEKASALEFRLPSAAIAALEQKTEAIMNCFSIIKSFSFELAREAWLTAVIRRIKPALATQHFV
jgi:hypothetical protein